MQHCLCQPCLFCLCEARLRACQREYDVQDQGDTVTARPLPDRPGEVVIEAIEGDGGRLSLVAAQNCAGIAALETLKLLGAPRCGVGLRLHKVRRLGPGLGLG